jgi:hypothetical protein
MIFRGDWSLNWSAFDALDKQRAAWREFPNAQFDTHHIPQSHLIVYKHKNYKNFLTEPERLPWRFRLSCGENEDDSRLTCRAV